MAHAREPEQIYQTAVDAIIVAAHAGVDKAAKDWPQINFVIYHSALRMFLESPPTG